jgi:hypothetical protein
MSKIKKPTPAATIPSSPIVGTRVIDAEDTARFQAAAKRYADANTATPQIARDTLVRLGIVTPSGKLTKNYR